ncbi:uncharacterized protein LOC119995568 [Tripterygium wilfordii]|uniref:uncharacterized protein LOC119995568 n=1 Tax=Tripterygium wilfordii TaxID=458696 RepID=UPI0018F82AE5|nr:uncharacterized protein LOC119995568 [Tripterygium wilfordii]
MKRFTEMTFDNSKGVREHIMEMRDIVSRLKSLEVDISNVFTVHYILNSLPAIYGPFKITYNTHKDKWSINELMAMCVQEEERLKNEKPNIKHESVNLVSHGKDEKGERFFNWKEKCKCANEGIWQEGCMLLLQENWTYEKDCQKYKKWLEKKGSSIHISNTMQGFLNLRKPKESEQSIYLGNRMHSQVEVVGTLRS